MRATSVLLALYVVIAWQPNLRTYAMNNMQTPTPPLKSGLQGGEGFNARRYCASDKRPPLGMVMDQLPYRGKCSHTGKVFGVGVFKTGTSSLSKELRTLGYTSCAKTRGFWPVGAAKGRYYYFDGPTLRQAIQADPETRYALRAMANLTLSATDGPWLFYHEEFDRWFPGSKFVLTTRKDPFQLVNSELGMRIGSRVPRRGEQENGALFPGVGVNLTLAKALRSYLNITNPKQSEKVKHTLQQLLVWGLLTSRRYDQHTAAVRRHFAGRPEDLLEICVDCDDGQDPDAALRTFLGCPHPPGAFPHVNTAHQHHWQAHTFFSQEDLDAGVIDWSRWPAPKFEPWTLPVYPDLVAAQVKRYAGTAGSYL